MRGGAAPELSTMMADFGADDVLPGSGDSADTELVNRAWVRRVLRSFAFISFVSVSINTPKTFESVPYLAYVTFVADLIVTFAFSAEMITKMHVRGIIRGERPYLKDRWCQFDGIMVLCHWVSAVVQIFELTHTVAQYSYWSILRCPRPLILVRVFRVFLKFQLPKTRVESIFKRSSQQVYNVTIFFLFFMSLYGILGVQFFGEMNYHCVRKDANESNISISDLAIPDTYCSRDNSGYSCPRGMKCVSLDLTRSERGFSGFDEFATSFFTVYVAASQEGWVFIMYKALDSLPSWKGFIFFISMIFFLSWLVKNVFIAVIIETFAEIRVHFQQMWGSRGGTTDSDTSQVLVCENGEWKMMTVDESKPRGRAPPFCQRLLKLAPFHIVIQLLVLVNAIVAASMHFDHRTPGGTRNKDPYTWYYYTEIGFTVVFDLEALFKIWCLGLRGYVHRSVHKFELLLVICTTLHIIPQLYRTHMTYFQVLRVVRLIRASPMLEDFCFKIFGPGKKLGSLVLFTMCLLIITSSVSLQLFCSIEGFNKFATFPQGTMSMFQILTQKGWNEVMHSTMWQTSERIAPFVAIYFIFYHLFVTLIVVSLFVAVILDNLELDEDIKRLKQLKMREQVAETQRNLPLRLRIFEKFPDCPQMVQLGHNRIPSDFDVAPMRDSFLRQFLEQAGDVSGAVSGGSGGSSSTSKDAPLMQPGTPGKCTDNVEVLSSTQPKSMSTALSRHLAVADIIRESNNHRMIGEDNVIITAAGSLLSKQHQVRMEMRRSIRTRPGSLSMKSSAPAFQLTRENGDLKTGTTLQGTASDVHKMDEFDIKILQQKRHEAEVKRSQREEDLRENHPFFDTPLFAVGRDSRFRAFCKLIVNARYSYVKHDPVTGKEVISKYKQIHKLLSLVTYLDWVMIVITTLSCISMMFETASYRVMTSPKLQIAEYTFVIGMSLEMGLKIMANGLFFTPSAVVRDLGGVLDLFIYGVSLLLLCWMPKTVPQNSAAQILMILRCLRPLRIFILVPHMRRVVYELCRGFKEILLVSILLILLMFMFASYGVQLFGGKLARCNDPAITHRNECVGIFERPLFVTHLKIGPQPNDSSYPKIFVPRVWANPRNFDFDNIGNAMQALFEVLSLEGWIEVRDVIIERVKPTQGIFIHLFVFIGCMIGLTLFVGVVIANYMENKGTALLTVDQKRWQDLMGRIKLAQPLHIPPRPEHSRLRSLAFDITQHILFKRGVAFLVLANCSLLAVPWLHHEHHTYPLATISATFTWLFFVEAVLKMTALGPSGYWQSRRNRFDMFVTILGVIWIFLHFALKADARSNQFGYFIIVLRFFTITGKHATLKMLMLTVVVSMFKSFFIIMGMFLLMLFYAFTGVILFGCVKYGEDLGRQANFQTALNAIVLLFRIVTGEDWNKIMHDCMVAPPFCTRGRNFWETDCGNYRAALVYFCTFYVIITYIVLNLLVAIIMENFSLFYSNEEDALLSYSDIRQFQATWNMVDVNRKVHGVIPVRRARLVLRLLKGRLEVDLDKDRLLFRHMCYELEKLRNGDDVTFHDVLSMLAYRLAVLD